MLLNSVLLLLLCTEKFFKEADDSSPYSLEEAKIFIGGAIVCGLVPLVILVVLGSVGVIILAVIGI